jgi:hypothetical protein
MLGLADVAGHVIERLLAQETRDQSVLSDVASNICKDYLDGLCGLDESSLPIP